MSAKVQARRPRLLALTKYGPGAASMRQRFLQYRPALSEAGFSVDFSPLLGDDHMQRLAAGRRAGAASAIAAYARRLRALLGSRGYDLLWVQYELFPFLPAFVERLAAMGKARLVVDYDDAIFHMYDEAPNPLVRALLGRKLAPLLRSANLCCCGNAYLERYARQYCPRTMLLPTVVDTDVYAPSAATSDPSPPLIGWIGSPSTAPYLQPLMPLLSSLAKSGRARVRIVGAGAHVPAAEHVEFVEWSEEREVAEVQSMDIGIMPLPDDKWARGKCGYKLVQYMACGLPVVASPVGVNEDIVEHGRNGFLATTAQEWETALDSLVCSPHERRRMGEAGRRRAVDDYSLAVHAPRLVEAMKDVLERAR